ncbi:MAG: transporter related [Sedimentibacter sp.]|jgi:molybdate transport system ATP-binding protein|nr:transporter related [Sedimentibacter sp.]
MSLKVDIKKKFKGFNLSVSFETNKEYLGLLGASGSGKSMTLKCISGIEPPDEGFIELNGRVLYDSDKKINLKPQDRNIGYLFQDYALFPNMTVEENIEAGLKLSKKEKVNIVEEMITKFHLQGLEKKYPVQLSGGQKQRTALARCIAYKPDVLLLDEPFSALDAHLKTQVQIEIMELLKLYTGEVLIVTHSMEEAYKFCKNLVILKDGNSVLFGDTKEIFMKPELASVARLTGCKNISSCTLVSTNKIYAHEWDIEIELNESAADIGFVGIKSNSFVVADDSSERTNIIECEIIDVIEKIQGYTIIFTNKKSRNTASHMYFDIKKEKWNNRNNKNNLFLKIINDSVLLLK